MSGERADLAGPTAFGAKWSGLGLAAYRVWL